MLTNVYTNAPFTPRPVFQVIGELDPKLTYAAKVDAFPMDESAAAPGAWTKEVIINSWLGLLELPDQYTYTRQNIVSLFQYGMAGASPEYKFSIVQGMGAPLSQRRKLPLRNRGCFLAFYATTSPVMNMNQLNRRQWLASLASAALGAPAYARALRAAMDTAQDPNRSPLPLKDYEPRSMLRVTETKVERSRFPVIDFHTHLSFVDRNAKPEKSMFRAKREEILPVMDRKNVRTMVNLTGGYGVALEETIRYWQTPSPDRFIVFTEPWFNKAAEANYPQFQADQIVNASKIGARGLKVLKTLGLYLRENVNSGPLVKVDDKRFDPMWEACGALKMPVAIHTSDPEAFFLPTDRFNERYEELSAHPDWSFHGKDFPGNRELHEARLRVIARHPKTQFVALHVGNAEDLGWVSQWLDRHPNLSVEIGARIGELGRQPRASRKFFDKYQDRILFGTDAVPYGKETPQQIFGELLYEIYFRFLETEDEYFDYAPAPIPPQGRWKIYGLGLPESVLKKVYYENAARLLGLSG